MVKRLVSGMWLVLLGGVAFAQQPVQTVPGFGTTIGGNVSGTLAGATYQQLWPATQRRSCTIVNQGSFNMFVTEGLTAAASVDSLAVKIIPGQAYYCNSGVTVLQGAINIRGTTGDAFYAAQY